MLPSCSILTCETRGRIGDGRGIAYATNYLAALVRQRGDHRQAARLSAEAVRWLISLGDRFYLIFAVEDLARARTDGHLDQSGARLLGGAHAVRLASVCPSGARTGAHIDTGLIAEHDQFVGADGVDKMPHHSFTSPWLASTWRVCRDCRN